MAPEAPPAKQDLAYEFDTGRLAWLDAAKGIGIILVVYGHQLRSQTANGHVDPSWHALTQDALIYAFHMPLFFFVSGLTIARTFQTNGRWQFARSRLAIMMYPYTLWSLVSLGLARVGYRYVNHQVGWGNVIAIFWEPVFQFFWSLYALFLCYMTAFCVCMRRDVTAVIAVAALILPSDVRCPILIDTIISFPFFAAGIVLSPRVLKSANQMSRLGIAVVGFACPIGFLALFLSREMPYHDAAPYKVALAACGIATVLAFSMAIGERSRLLVILGMASMAIFILHTIAQTAIRSALSLSPWLDTNVVQLLCYLVGGLAIPLAIRRAVSVVGLELYLGLGSAPKRRSE